MFAGHATLSTLMPRQCAYHVRSQCSIALESSSKGFTHRIGILRGGLLLKALVWRGLLLGVGHLLRIHRLLVHWRLLIDRSSLHHRGRVSGAGVAENDVPIETAHCHFCSSSRGC